MKSYCFGNRSTVIRRVYLGLTFGKNLIGTMQRFRLRRRQRLYDVSVLLSFHAVKDNGDRSEFVARIVEVGFNSAESTIHELSDSVHIPRLGFLDERSGDILYVLLGNAILEYVPIAVHS